MQNKLKYKFPAPIYARISWNIKKVFLIHMWIISYLPSLKAMEKHCLCLFQITYVYYVDLSEINYFLKQRLLVSLWNCFRIYLLYFDTVAWTLVSLYFLYHSACWFSDLVITIFSLQKFDRCEQGSNLRGETPLDFKSNALTTRPSQLATEDRLSFLYPWTCKMPFTFSFFLIV